MNPIILLVDEPSERERNALLINDYFIIGFYYRAQLKPIKMGISRAMGRPRSVQGKEEGDGGGVALN